LELIIVPAELLRACHIFLAMCLDLFQHVVPNRCGSALTESQTLRFSGPQNP